VPFVRGTPDTRHMTDRCSGDGEERIDYWAGKRTIIPYLVRTQPLLLIRNVNKR